MANQTERAELHKTIWKIANDLRGSVDGWEFKAYVLGSIFYRFISENICDYIQHLPLSPTRWASASVRRWWRRKVTLSCLHNSSRMW